VRWFVVLLLLANIVLFFWVQQQSKPAPGSTSLPPPEVGRLRLITEIAEPQLTDTPPASAAKDAEDQVQVAAGPRKAPMSTSPAPTPDTASAAADEEETVAGSVPGVSSTPRRAPAAAAEREQSQPAPAPAAPAAQPAIDAAPEAREAETAVEPSGPPSGREQVAVAETAEVSPIPTPRPEVTVAEPACARVGPFEPQDADTLISRLPPYVQLVSDTSEEYAEEQGYYVLIPPLPSRAAGMQKLKELEDAGITDVWLFRTGELMNAISLGLYRNEQGARQHAAGVAKKGFVSEVRERIELKERRWLQLKNTQGGDPRGGMPLPDGVQVIRQACP